jgi:hypothetical protein
MFLQPSEVGFLKHLKEARVPLEEFEFPSNKISNIQNQLEKLIGQNYYLNKVSYVPWRCVPSANNAISPQKMDTVPIYRLMPHTVCGPSSTYTSLI